MNNNKIKDMQGDVKDLLALTALDLIDGRDRHFAEDLAAANPELELELRSLQATVNALAYAQPILPVPANLKQRLFEQIQPPKPSQEVSVNSPAFWAIRASELNWQPHSVSGITIAMLHTDPVQRLVSALVRCAPGAIYPPHRHAIGEEIFMIEGDLVSDGVTYTTGDFLYSASSSVHAPSSTYGCMFLVRTSMDDVFV